MLQSSLSLIAGKVSTMALGFLFWLLAARLFSSTQVGLAAGAVSAVMLCTQLGLLGLGSAVILRFPAHAARPSRLLDTAFTMVGASAFLAAGAFLLLAANVFEELSVVASLPLFTVAFIMMSVIGTAGILFDQVSTALRRGDQALGRALLFGAVTVAVLTAVAAGSGADGSVAIFSPWVAGGLAACLLGLLQLRRTLSRYRYRPRIERRLAEQLLRVGLPNHLLTLTERAPGLILPIVVTELISPAANAAWYAAWMMAWVLYIIPIQVGMTTFAEAAHRPGALPWLVRHAIRSSLALGCAGAVVFALAAPLLLSALGPAYSSAATTPLRVLVLAVIPLTFVQAYFVRCRSTGRLTEATVTGALSGLAALGGAAAAGSAYGLTGMAAAWVAVQILTAAWATWRVFVGVPLHDASGQRASADVPASLRSAGLPDIAARS